MGKIQNSCFKVPRIDYFFTPPTIPKSLKSLKSTPFLPAKIKIKLKSFSKLPKFKIEAKIVKNN